MIGNMVFLCMFLPVLQCWKWQENGKLIVSGFTIPKSWLYRDLQIFSDFTYLFSTLAIPKSPSCTVPSFVKNMFYADIIKRNVNKATRGKYTTFYHQGKILWCTKQYLRFDVPVEDFSIMYMLQCQANLHKPIQDLGNGEDGKHT